MLVPLVYQKASDYVCDYKCSDQFLPDSRYYVFQCLLTIVKTSTTAKEAAAAAAAAEVTVAEEKVAAAAVAAS